jgi:hypothetical protein
MESILQELSKWFWYASCALCPPCPVQELIIVGVIGNEQTGLEEQGVQDLFVIFHSPNKILIQGETSLSCSNVQMSNNFTNHGSIQPRLAR